MNNSSQDSDFIHEIIFPASLNNTANFPLPKEAQPKDIQCKLCKIICTDVYEFNKHARQKHNKLLCDICSKILLKSKEAKNDHLEKEHIREYCCAFCSKKFWQQKQLNHHIKDMHYNRKTDTLKVDDLKLLNQLNISSPLLKEEFFIHDVVKEEIKIKKVKEENEGCETGEAKEEESTATITETTTKMKCKLCEEEYEDNKSFNKHAKRHGYRILCEFCSQVFFDKPTLEFHHMIKHDKSIFCKECSKKFWLQKGLEEHYAKVHRKK